MSNIFNEPYPKGVNPSPVPFDLVLSDAQHLQLERYLDMIKKWNGVYNLTALRDLPTMRTHHLYDSLAVIAPLRQQLEKMGKIKNARLLDVGSGAGLPGVIMAICCPDITVTCVDTVAKKAAFIQQVAIELRLPNLKGLHARVESIRDQYDVISARAFSSLKDLTAWSVDALAENGIWLAMKGAQPDLEIKELPETIKVFHVEHLQVPELNAQRCIIWIRTI